MTDESWKREREVVQKHFRFCLKRNYNTSVTHRSQSIEFFDRLKAMIVTEKGYLQGMHHSSKESSERMYCLSSFAFSREKKKVTRRASQRERGRERKRVKDMSHTFSSFPHFLQLEYQRREASLTLFSSLLLCMSGRTMQRMCFVLFHRQRSKEDPMETLLQIEMNRDSLFYRRKRGGKERIQGVL